MEGKQVTLVRIWGKQPFPGQDVVKSGAESGCAMGTVL